VGCLILLLGLVPGRTQNPSAPPEGQPNPERPARAQNPDAPPVDDVQGDPKQLPDRPPPGLTAPNNWADERFRRLDRNGNGLLEVEEMTENLKAEKDLWDVNKDGVIDLDEWRAYIKAFTQQHRLTTDSGNPPRNSKRNPRRPAPDREIPVQKGVRPLFPEREPHAQRVMWPPVPAGQEQQVPRAVRPPFKEKNPRKDAAALAVTLPRNVPPWFKEYDTDRDGQVSLIEWKEREDDTREFRKYDLNGDGVISLEELVHSGQFFTGLNPPPVLVGTDPEIGQFYYWRITGTTQGSVWGTDIYTIDSPMGTAAVHAGVLQEGETAFVKIILLPGQQHYDGSSANGIETHDRHTGYHKSFRVEAIR